VHAHEDVVDGPDAHGPAGDGLHAAHGNHGLAIFLTTHYNSGSRIAPLPLAVVARAIGIAPVFRPIGSVDRFDAQSTHGPPGSTWLTRAPPSLS
jgi:hypothetical protein